MKVWLKQGFTITGNSNTMTFFKGGISWKWMGLVALVLFTTQCQVSNTPVSSIAAPFQNTLLEPNRFKVDNQTGGHFETAEGTTIDVPANCFVDMDGNPIDGKVDLVFREFHRPEEVLISGIPMQYEKDGKEGNLVTAGMFEIKGTHENRPVGFAEGKAIDLSMPSTMDAEDVAFYKLDSQNGTWAEKDMAHTKKPIVTEIPEELQALEASLVEPEMPDTNRADANVIDLEFNDKRLAGLKSSLWKYAGDNPKNDPFNHEEFVNGDYHVSNYELLNTEKPKVRVTFELKTGVTSRAKITSDLTPVLTGSEMNEALDFYEKNKVKYDQRLAEVQERKNIYESDFVVKRSFSLNGFGYYNWDGWMHSQRMVTEPYILSYHNEKVNEQSSVYLIRKVGKRTGVVNQTMYMAGSGKLYHSKTEDVTLVFVMPNNKVGTVSPETFAQYKADQLEKLPLDQIVEIEKTEDLRQVFASL